MVILFIPLTFISFHFMSKSVYINLYVCNINLKSSTQDEMMVENCVCAYTTYKYIMFPKPNILVCYYLFPPPFHHHHHHEHDHHHQLTLRMYSLCWRFRSFWGFVRSFVYFKSTCKMVLRNIKCFCREKQTNKQKTKEKNYSRCHRLRRPFCLLSLGRQNKNINILRC